MRARRFAAGFVRPGARDMLDRWREALIALAVIALGGYWVLGSFGILHWLGYVVIAIGAALLFTGIQRARFRAGRGGPGVVQVVEGQVTYFGPLDGGAVAIGEMTALVLDPTGRPPHWVLSQPGRGDLHVPLTAEGAEALFDAFASLPGIRTGQMLAEMERNADRPVVIWRKPVERLH